MTEQDAINQIKEKCKSGDFEMNGSNLDQIIQDFLRGNGFKRLANAIMNVECWRA